MTGELHQQVEASFDAPTGGPVMVDAQMVDLLNALHLELGAGYGTPAATYESCQNYGEYLRNLGLDHIFESQRDYAYIEFFDRADAMEFLYVVKAKVDVKHPLFHQISMEGTPGAWELKFRLSNGNWWVWFPSESIEEVAEVLRNAQV